LIKACQTNCVEIVERLLRADAETDSRNKVSSFLWFFYCPLLILKFSFSFPPLPCQQFGRTALIEASIAGNTAIVSLLLRYRANPNAQDHVRLSPFDISLQISFIKTNALTFRKGNLH
jgi:ankyrin repeat protein